ncbi:hypothetical protein VULLAG_LOCUS6119 [Vulpes lagopus]
MWQRVYEGLISQKVLHSPAGDRRAYRSLKSCVLLPVKAAFTLDEESILLYFLPLFGFLPDEEICPTPADIVHFLYIQTYSLLNIERVMIL